MPRTKGSENRPKTIHTDYVSQIAEKQESITSLTAEIASITAKIDTLKADLKEKKSALKKAEKEVDLDKAITANHQLRHPSEIPEKRNIFLKISIRDFTMQYQSAIPKCIISVG